MSAPSAQTLQRLANETGLQAGTLEKVLRLLDVLQEIARDLILANRMVLKGGTALNVLHLALDRMSVDIDLNYVGALDRADMGADRPEVDAALNRLLTAQGYTIRRQPDDHAGGKWIGRFASAMGGGGSLEVDINSISRQPLFGAVKMDSVDLGGVRASGVAVLDLHEVVAGKLVALIDRNAARDLFDARRILDIDGLDCAKIKAAVLAYGAAGRRDWRLASVEAIGGDPRELRQKLAICLPQNRFVAAGGPEAWIVLTVAECRARLAPLFELNAAETAFLDGILDRGEIDPGGLDVAPEVQVRIAAMPMLAWKCQNVRAHRG
ncbi:nucleotidyl transferase AbiEii/AbiGii toxin family protein [Caulobacter sp. DWP3-1-3b2]|uniref:nucleotidyl transferase AbiEii/AbiGii toxin family protein n=1 Tax=Caulobacter sp. DWP3-1-3b2 TaxID=2804643 RepID=UPI003CF40BA9